MKKFIIFAIALLLISCKPTVMLNSPIKPKKGDAMNINNEVFNQIDTIC